MTHTDHLEPGFRRHNVRTGHLLNKWGRGCLLFSLGWGEVCLRQGLSQTEQRIVLPEDQSCSLWSIVGSNQRLQTFAFRSQPCVRKTCHWVSGIKAGFQAFAVFAPHFSDIRSSANDSFPVFSYRLKSCKKRKRWFEKKKVMIKCTRVRLSLAFCCHAVGCWRHLKTL